jgi:oligosaccharide repeat unit polymerase
VYTSVIVGLSLLPLLLCAVLARLIFKSWLAPGAFFALYWLIASVIPAFFLAKHEINPNAMLWIFLAVISVCIGNLLVLKVDSKRLQLPSNPFLSTAQKRYLKLWIVASTILGTLSVVTVLWESGYSFGMLFSLNSLINIANAFSINRYEGLYAPSIHTQILLVFTYLGPAVAGFLAATTTKRKDYLFSAISFIPAILLMLVRTQRGALIATGVIWLSAYLVANCVQGRLRPFKKRQVLIGILALPLLIFVFALVAMARAGTTDTSLLPMLIRKVTAGATGHIAAFSIWFERDSFQFDPMLGQITFAGLFNALGIYTRQLGLFQEFIYLDSGFTTNIYTLFRPLIQDFTIVGALFSLFVFGLIGGLAYQSALKGNIRSLALLTGVYTTILFSAYSSIWIWGSIIAGFIGYTVCLWFLPNISRPRVSTRERKTAFGPANIPKRQIYT